MKQILKFTVDSALLKELGEKLVETVHLALSELVKNSYDADATEVEIIFESDSEGNDLIKIVDNGVGMNFEAVKNYWMRIATTNKRESNQSKVYGRYLTGAKGVGRFSCRRLGQKLTLITNGTSSGNKLGLQKEIQRTEVVFPWTEFESGSDVTTIECVGEETIIKEGYTGTTLIIEGISDEWNHRGFNWLKRQLAVLTANRGVHRDGFKEDKGFLIMLTAPDFNEDIIDLREDLLNAGWGTLTAFINKNNQAVCELNALGIGKRKIVSDFKFKSLRDISLKLGIMLVERAEMRDVSILSKQNLVPLVRDWGGVQIKYRNFRVADYGDVDWLDLDKDRARRLASPKDQLLDFADALKGVEADRSLLNMLSMKNYIGDVKIGERATGFEMKASREGFVESEATLELKKFVRFAIDWSTILRDYHKRQESLKVAFRAREEFENFVAEDISKNRIVDSALGYIGKQINTVADKLEPEERKQLEEVYFKATEAIKSHNDSINYELAHLRLIASTSTLLLVFSHEVKSLLGLLAQNKTAILNVAKKLNDSSKKELVSISNDFSDLNDRLEELLEMTSLVSSNKKKYKRGRVALKPKIIKIEKVLGLILGKYEIKINYDSIKPNIIFKNILEAEVYSIFLNIISNSIKSIIAKGGKKREIEINASVEDGFVKINILDSGIGLSEDKFEEVFIPFIADPEGKLYENLENKINPGDNMIIGSGSGLGLGIVKEIVINNEGFVKFIKPRNGWSSEIEMYLK
ncbi:ATP-binding protein [Polaribacter pectinis]|uniref:histidine kinase n=1 Tax=Polaribacter pectinis TaxID=2738844 RepID=A0A7G9LBI9_9FLAO|nr:ATP-binding protein [Polaribacter pectinis]QNM85988.1 ATP-binding protein [Polaribacter pectinis]